MTLKPHLWEGKTGGGKWGQKFLFFFLRVINVTVLYPVLFLIVPFYMLFRRKGYLAIFRYFKNIWKMSSWRAFWNTFANHFIFSQIVVDKFAAIAGNIKNFTIEIEDYDLIKELHDHRKGFIIASSNIGNFELGGYVFQQLLQYLQSPNCQCLNHFLNERPLLKDFHQFLCLQLKNCLLFR